MANFINQDIIITGLPAGCVGHDIHFTGYRATNIIILGKYSNHHICLRFRSGWCQDIPDSSSLGRKTEVCNTNRRDNVAGFSGEWTTIVSSKTWAGSATNMWTRCPRQAWPRGSLIIKHYRVQEGEPSTRVSKSLHKSGLALMKILLLLEQISQWLRVLQNSYGTKVISLTDHKILCTCMTDLGWF